MMNMENYRNIIIYQIGKFTHALIILVMWLFLNLLHTMAKHIV